MAGINRIKSPLSNRVMPDLPPDDVQIAVKASHDMLKEQLPDIIRKVLFDELQPKVKTDIHESLAKVTETLHSELELNVKSLRQELSSSFTKSIQERLDRKFSEYVVDNEATQNNFREIHTKSLDNITEVVKKEQELFVTAEQSLKKELNGEVSGRFQAIESGYQKALYAVGDMIRKELNNESSNRLNEIASICNKTISDETTALHKNLNDITDALHKHLDNRWESLVKSHDSRIYALEKTLEARQAEYSKAMDQLIEAVRSIRPEVHQQITVPASEVMFSPQINVPASEVTVNPHVVVPAAQVTVNPELKLTENALQLKVESILNQPDREKQIVYDEYSRPAIITERAVKSIVDQDKKDGS